MLISNIHLEQLDLQKALLFYDEIYSLFHFLFFLYTEKINSLEKRIDDRSEKNFRLFSKMKRKRGLLLKKFAIMLLSVA